MQAELDSNVALSAANALLSHLRKNPEASLTSARELALTFGLEESFVAQVLQGIHSNRKVEVRQAVDKRNPFRTAGESIISLWMRATAKPLRFIIATFLLSYLGIYGAASIIPRFFPKATVSETASGVIPPGVAVTLAGILGIVGLTCVIHLGVYFRHRRSRNAVQGAMFLLASTLVLWILPFLGGGAKESGTAVPNVAIFYLIGAMVSVLMSMMYAGMGSLASILGAWWKIKVEERAELTMSRQELLERYFELQNRLQKSAYPRPATQEPGIFKSPLIAWYRRYQLIFNLVLGFVVGVVKVVGFNATGIRAGRMQLQAGVNPWLFALIFVGIFSYMFYAFQGYISKSGWRAALGALCVAASGQILILSPIGYKMRPIATPSEYVIGSLVQALFYVGIACGSYMGAVVQLRSVREANLQGNDQATLLAEMVRIQWKLSDEIAAVCVLVVDAAGSSVMKASEDPLLVEYSFREYQEWIGAICEPRGGRVHSTAGDGAVVAFSTCPDALSAAKKIQTDLGKFNQEVNRLAHPFRLRIGLHTGEVVGDINKVQFTEVIDIAAHIESTCPVGGIAVTDDVAQRLPEEQFVELAVQVDRHQVFVVSNPTENG